MTKGKSTWKYNKLLTPRRKYFLEGGPVGPGELKGIGPVNTMLANPSTSFALRGNITSTNNSSVSKNDLIGGIASMGASAATSIGNMITNIQSKDVTENADNIINSIKGQQSSAQSVNDSFDNLMNDYANNVTIDKVTKEQLGYKNFGQGFSEALGSATSGAASGASLGPIAAGVGAGFNALTSIIGNVARNRKIKEERDRINDQIAYTNAFNERSLMNRADNLNADVVDNALLNTAAFGGELNTNGGDFTNGLLFINNGGSHESNPYEGVPMGVDQEGTPNLVEEGETIFNDYVFSKRLKVPKAVRDKYKLRGNKSISFADASKKLAKESEERPNDSISMRGLETMMADLAGAQEELKAKKRQSSMFAYGGKVNKFAGEPWTPSKINKYNYIKDGYYGLGEEPFWIKDGSYTDEYRSYINSDSYNTDAFRQHLKNQFAYYDDPNVDKSSNRYKAIKYFIDSNPEWYANRSTIDSWNIDAALLQQAKSYALSKPGFMHPEDVARAALSGNTAEASSPAEVGVTPTTEAIATNQPKVRGKKFLYRNADGQYIESTEKNAPVWMRNNGYFFNNSDSDDDFDYYYYDPKEEIEQGKYADWLRYAPALGFGIGAMTDAFGWTNKPDYGNADAILEAAKSAGKYQPVAFNPIGNYLTYKPFDRDYYINKMNAQSGATRRNIMNTSAGNRATAMAGLLAADNNFLNQVGTLGRQAEEYNLAQRQQIEGFNRDTDKTNSEGFLQADMANQKALMSSGELYLKGAMAAAEMREKAGLTSDANKSTNISGLFQSLGDIGFEEKNARMRDWAIAHGVFGPGTKDYGRFKVANGGKIKRRKGLTV